ncbi:MAG: molybdopterin cofactor-binding domain-containing protein [Bauldia sp.]
MRWPALAVPRSRAASSSASTRRAASSLPMFTSCRRTGHSSGRATSAPPATALSLVYQPVAMRWRALPVLTNTPPPGPQRGPGENQFTTALEPILDKAAAKLGIDRVAIRKINAPDTSSKLGADQGPVTSAFIKEALDKGAQMFDWANKSKLSKTKVGNKVIGVGVGQGYHSAGSNGFDGLLRITPDGKLHIHSGVGNLGTFSHETIGRVAAEFLNYKWENTVEERGDSRKGTPWSSVQAGSLSTSTHSRTMYVAAMDAKTKLLDIAAQMLGGKPEDYDLGEEKVVHKTDATKSITMAQAAQKAIDLGGKYSGKEVPTDINAITKSAVGYVAGTGLVAVAKDSLPRVGVTPGLVASFARVEIDTETGKIEVKELVTVADCGTVVHPMGLGNQMKGGAVQGLGMAFLERHVYDPKLGIPAAVGFEASKLPSYLDVPAEIQWAAVEMPDPQNPVGVKGVGEPAEGGPSAAIASAIADALGVTFNHYPVSIDQIVNHLNGRPQAHKPLQINTV